LQKPSIFVRVKKGKNFNPKQKYTVPDQILNFSGLNTTGGQVQKSDEWGLSFVKLSPQKRMVFLLLQQAKKITQVKKIGKTLYQRSRFINNQRN
jgi:hypothetical protein